MKKSEELLLDQIYFEFNKLINLLSEVKIKEDQPGATYLKMTISAAKEAQGYFRSMVSVGSGGGILDKSSNAKPL